MKRKLLSIFASFVVVLTVCICLVGCTKVTPAGLDTFMKDYVKSSNKAIHVEDEHYSGTNKYSFVQLKDNKMYLLEDEKSKTGKRIRTYYEYEEDKKRIITYVGTKQNKSDKNEKEEWVVTTESVDSCDFKAVFNKMIDPKTGYDAQNGQFVDYNSLFDIDGKWIVAKNDIESVVKGTAFKIEGKVLRINYQYHEKDENGKEMKDFHNARLIKDYGDVLIPDDALDVAVKLGIKEKKKK